MEDQLCVRGILPAFYLHCTGSAWRDGPRHSCTVAYFAVDLGATHQEEKHGLRC